MGQIEDDASFVVRSPHRTTVLQRLGEGAAIPSQIKSDTDMEYSRITEASNSLRDRGLIELLVDDDTKRGRLYSITDRGQDVLDFMRQNGMLVDEQDYGRR
jgi:DNA-binding MarR family transcriptional regulator